MTTTDNNALQVLIDEIEKGNILAVMRAKRLYSDYVSWMSITMSIMPLPSWEDLPDAEKKAWLMSAHGISRDDVINNTEEAATVAGNAPLVMPTEETEALLLFPASPAKKKDNNDIMVDELKQELLMIKEKCKFFEDEFKWSLPESYERAKFVYEDSIFRMHPRYCSII